MNSSSRSHHASRSISVLVIDPSAVARRAIRGVLESEREIERVATAATPTIARAKLASERFDAIVSELDFGSELSPRESRAQITAIARDHEHMRFVAWVRRAAPSDLDVLVPSTIRRIVKPDVMSDGDLEEVVRTELLVSLLPGRVSPRKSVPVERDPIRLAPPCLGPLPQVKLIAIGASTGGPDALTKVLSQLPGTLPVPLIITQHMPRDMTPHLATSLDSKCKIRVREAKNGGTLDPGVAWIAPGDRHLVLRGTGTLVRIALSNAAPVQRCRPAVDPMFESAAKIVGRGVVGVVLTGMGHDGLSGSRAIHEVGGTVIAQDEETSVVWGMPGAVARDGIARAVVALTQIPHKLVGLVHRRGLDSSEPTRARAAGSAR